MRYSTAGIFSVAVGLCFYAFGGIACAGPNSNNPSQSPNADIPTTGVSAFQEASIDALIRACLTKHEVPGAALAITYQGRLVYARGFGYAVVENGKPVKPDSLFRIASVSKPVTATAILKLCEAGKLELDTRTLSLFDHVEPFLEGDDKFDQRLEKVTIRQLLQHRAGWDRGEFLDPMFASRKIASALGTSPPASHDDTIRYMFGKPLDFDPGERYCYSNFGYCLLGRVIEKLSGQPYEEYVQQQVLAPAGIVEMQIGRTLECLRRPGEVKYYDPGVGQSVFDSGKQAPEPYGVWNLEAMDAHGGWIASATDLVKFASRYSRHAEPRLLSEKSLAATIECPLGLAGYDEDGAPRRIYYGLGWEVEVDAAGRLVEESHLGSLPGTSTLLVRRADGVCYALLFNARKTPFTWNVCEAVLGDLREAIDAVPSWPSVDYFGKF